jgi:hypothetical protein
MSRASAIPSGFYPSEFAIVAAANNTTVTITPSATANLINSHSGPYSITLQKGQTYQICSSDNASDVTGTFVDSDKPIGVFGGTKDASVPDGYASGNPLVEEQLPVVSWGMQTLGFPLATRLRGDIYRVLAAYDGTDIYINGIIVATMNKGEFYDTIIDGPVEFQGSNPIQVAQFSTGQDYDGTYGNPFEILLPPTGHYMKTYRIWQPVFCFPPYSWIGYINLIVEHSPIIEVFIDGVPVPASSFLPIGGSGYYGAQVQLSPLEHTISSSNPVEVQVYGFSYYDSFGYMGGIDNGVQTPTGLTATPGNSQVALSWTASSDATSYNVYRSTSSGGPYTKLNSSPITTTTYTDAGVTSGTTYYYEVSAVNDYGESAMSGPVSATPQTPLPNAPTLISLQFPYEDGSGIWYPGEIEINATDNPDYIKVYMNADTTPISQGIIYMPECGGQLAAARWQGNPVDLYNDEVNFSTWMTASEVKNCVEGPMCARVQCSPTPPTIITPPQSQCVTVGNPVTFTVGANGAQLYYQWQFNGVYISGATNPTYSIPPVTQANAGNYTVWVSNPYGPPASATAVLTVVSPPPPPGPLLPPVLSTDYTDYSAGEITWTWNDPDGRPYPDPDCWHVYFCAYPGPLSEYELNYIFSGDVRDGVPAGGDDYYYIVAVIGGVEQLPSNTVYYLGP